MSPITHSPGSIIGLEDEKLMNFFDKIFREEIVLVYLSVDNLFTISEKKVLEQNGPYINTFQNNLRINFCLSVILEFCLSSSFVSSLQLIILAYVEV